MIIFSIGYYNVEGIKILQLSIWFLNFYISYLK